MATVYIPVDDNWIDLGQGPMVLQVKGGVILVSTGSTLPLPDEVTNCFKVNDIFSYAGTENVYVKREYDPLATEVGVVKDSF